MEILESSITTNVLLALFALWHFFGKKALDAYASKKGTNRADKEDLKSIEGLKKEGSLPYDIELEKLKAQASYIVEEYKESLKVRIDTKRKLYDWLVELKVYTRKFYNSNNSNEEAQSAFDNFKKALDEVSDFMSCNKHFINEIDPQITQNFERTVNNYMNQFIAANESIKSGKPDETLIKSRNQLAERLLDEIDSYLAIIFKINPAELPYNKSMQPTAKALAD
jgi:hypothetical protein